MPYYGVSRVVAYLQMEVCAPLAAARTVKNSPPPPPLTDAVCDIARLTLRCDKGPTPLPASLLSLWPKG
jgi:hypothetical protein